jgi:hypothetical protein
VSTVIVLTRGSGGPDGYGAPNLPLERDIEEPVVIDASRLGASWHVVFAVRLRLFVDWHLAAGHEVSLRPPTDASAREALASFEFENDLPSRIFTAPLSAAHPRGSALLPIARLATDGEADDAAARAVEVLRGQTADLAVWGDAMHMAIGELCDNALDHGRNELGAYVAADRVRTEPREFRLAIADLGIGIPEHIRARHPEWYDDTAAIGNALAQGVTGTGDPHRGNGFEEVFDAALESALVATRSTATIDIRSGSGRVGVELVAGDRKVSDYRHNVPRRGTWITYTVRSV